MLKRCAENFSPLEELLSDEKKLGKWQYVPMELNKDIIRDYTEGYQVLEWVTDYYDSEPCDDWECSDEEKYNWFHELTHKVAEGKASKKELQQFDDIYEKYEEQRIKFCNWQDVEDAWIDEAELPQRAYQALVDDMKSCGKQLNKRVFKMVHKEDSTLVGIFIYLRDITTHDTAIIFKKE